MRTGGQLVVDCLAANGIERAFGVPGESYLAVLDALHDSGVQFVICRQEGGAAMMADAHARLTGRPGVCFVTRGPGATNASPGIHIAAHDSTPLVMFVGQVGRDMRGREAFQEIDYRAFFGSVAKWVVEIDDAARIPELVTRAFAVAMSGRPGPVVVALPEDMLRDMVDAPQPQAADRAEPAPSPDDVTAFEHMLRGASAPIAILGGSTWDEMSVAQFQHFAENWALPVGVQFRRQMLFDALSPSYAGDVGIGINPSLARRIRDADLVLLLGGRFAEVPSSGYTLIDVPNPRQTLVHVHPDPEELGRVYQPALGINASARRFVAALAALTPPNDTPWAEATAAAHEAYLKWSTPPAGGPGDVSMGEIMRHIEATVGEDGIFCNGAGNYATWLHRFHRFRRFATQAAPTSGSMGYGIPGAVAAKLAFPDREVVAFAGDGCFLMNGQEFATAIQYAVPFVTLVVNNGMYGTIRMHQERDFPGRVSGTSLVNPDFAALARAFGGHGETVTRTEEFAPAFARARESGKPAIVEIRLDPEAITPSKTLSDFRAGR